MNASADATNQDQKAVQSVQSIIPRIQRVTKRQVLQQIQQSKKETFLIAFKQTDSNISVAAEKARIDRGTYYNWLETDSDFAMAVLNAQESITDEIRANLINEARISRDMTAIIFYLKHKDPQFKEERGQVNVQINNNADGLAETLKALFAKLA